jgi:hypothetical protein
MSLNPLAPLTDYQSMQTRIFWFTSVAALACVWLLRLYIPALDAALGALEAPLNAGSDKSLPAGYLVPALTVGIMTHIFRLHSRLSDLLGVRECFDLEIILAQFASALELQLPPPDELRRVRHPLMRKVFYPYVSSFSPQIDPQLIQQALDAWSWFWISVEATLLFTLTSFALIATGGHQIGLNTLAAALAFALIGLPALRRQCGRYATAQVREILGDPARAAAIRKAFLELTAEKPTIRLAA